MPLWFATIYVVDVVILIVVCEGYALVVDNIIVVVGGDGGGVATSLLLVLMVVVVVVLVHKKFSFFIVLNELVLSRISALTYSRLFKQEIRQTEIHIATDPVRSVAEDFAYTTIERNSNYLSVPKDMLPLNNRLLESEEYTAIDVNNFMEGFHTMGRYKYMNNVKAGLASFF